MVSQHQQAADALQQAAEQSAKILVGFDGFIDAIIDVVDKRSSTDDYTKFDTIGDLGSRITAAAGRSSNFELVVKQRKIGGNGPIMANALLRAGHNVDYLGVLGAPQPDVVFTPLVNGADRVVSLGDASQTDALEFSDGKLMLGKLTPLDEVNWDHLVEVVGLDGLIDWFAQVDAVATVNWTMILAMTHIWQELQRQVFPAIKERNPQWRPLWFVDLADPAKRDQSDIVAALHVLTALQQDVDVVLGLNGSEACQVAEVLGLAWQGEQESTDEAERIAAEINQSLKLQCVMVHLVGSAAAHWGNGQGQAPGFHCDKPLITTGAGDHFNAGFFGAILAGCDYRHALSIGGASSGHYVRTAHSPTRQELIHFLSQWPQEI